MKEMIECRSIVNLKLNFGWQTANTEIGIDAAAFLLSEQNVCERDENFIFYGNPMFLNGNNGEELFRFDYGSDLTKETAIVVGELYRYGDEWKFNAIGSGFNGGLEALCKEYRQRWLQQLRPL
ncbi:TerD family protein [Paenibacillus wynnii]|uniref:TerD family protein n=1 Tax=Paenibacillus wynnii TaxID=268407 RepID=UPI002794333B|nr:TerD family protein [Paenibacillus wynnii]MDQ0194950.1 stress response protein SCP2 [Paenibacillus wynnii]